jgi:putative redox protein
VARTAEVSVRWLRGQEFEGGGAGHAPLLVDGDGATATSPVETLLFAAATCTATDVVLILEKQRVKLAALAVSVLGTRREEQPRRFTAIAFHFEIRGAGADETKARRAIDLSLEKYCSVIASLAPDIQISYHVTVAPA